MRQIIGIIKLFFFGLLCTIIIPIQMIWCALFKNSPLYFIIPKIFNRLTLFIFRIRIITRGNPKEEGHIIYLGNHLSYIDIPVLGGNLNATFIAKADVKGWPVFGTLASISQTIYIERNRSAAIKCIEDISAALNNGRSLILFPEGTSTQGVSVYPFKSSLFELFLNPKLKNDLIIQPFTLSIKNVDQRLAQSGDDFDTYAWHSDMELPPHLWALAKSKGVTLGLEFHAPRPALQYDNRKLFAQDCEMDVKTGLQKAISETLYIGS